LKTSEDLGEIQTAVTAMETVSAGFGKRVHEAAAQGAGAAPEAHAQAAAGAGNGSNGGSAKQGDDIKDAEFTVKDDK